MVDPSPPINGPVTGAPVAGASISIAPISAAAAEKAALRAAFRKARAAHFTGLPQGLRALMLSRPPGPVTAMMPEGATVGLYHPAGSEAPSLGWARWLAENGRRVALPWFAARGAPMEFRLWDNPWDEERLERGPWRALQPSATSEPAAPGLVPDLIVVPLLAFTVDGRRLGQGGGHYDRWLADHPHVPAIGLAWDCQIAEALPHEDHDRPLAAVVTPTRIYEGAPAMRPHDKEAG